MSLDGAKLICLGKDPSEDKNVILAKGKTFKFGYYMDCDVILEHSDALGLHCTIDCDAFGRVTIANLCSDQVITLNGKPLNKLRPLLHNTEICIFDEKFLWQFARDEDLIEYGTPSQQTKKAIQPPNSEPGRRWRTHDNRLTIHTFSYSIKSGEESKVEELQLKRNEEGTCKTIDGNSSEPTTMKASSPVPSAMDDLIDLETPKPKQKSFAGQRTPLISCSFSETVITSYSPRNTSLHAQVKSYAVVQSPLGTPRKLGTQSDVTPGPFKQTPSSLVLNQRPSMHLIDLTTPVKRGAPQSSFKAGQKSKIDRLKATNSSADSTSSTVFSVHSTDEESVIELSDDGSFSPSPVLRTPPRSRTPQSLMKRAILSSAKKVIRKPLPPPAAPPPLTPSTPKSPARVRFQSSSTPQRKSLARMESPSVDQKKASKSVVGPLTKSMVTSTPFRADQVERSKSRSSILRSPSTSLVQSSNKSRTSLMLRQVLTASPKHGKKDNAQLNKESLGTPPKLRKSVSFQEQPDDDTSTVNKTFSIEEIENTTNVADSATNSVSTPRKDATFSPEKKPNDQHITDDCIVVSFGEKVDEKVLERDETKEEQSKHSPITVAETPLSGVAINSKRESTPFDVSSTTLGSPGKSEHSLKEMDTQPSTHIVNMHLSGQQTPQSSKGRLRKTPLSIKPSSAKNLRNIIDEEDFEGLDSVFKTPKARNLMILSSPKSVSLQKPSTDSVELIQPTEFDLSTNLDVLFKTPQSELINRTITAPRDNDSETRVLSPEKAFDNLVGRCTVEKSYSRKKSAKQDVILPLDTDRDPDLPKTDIQEWIETVNQSIKHSEVEREEIEISYIAGNEGDITRDPLTMSTVSEGVTTTTKKNKITKESLADEIAMTIRKDGFGKDTEEDTTLNDPLEATMVTQSKKTISPNISGIDLLDHTSESAFSETLAISDDSSEKENFQHIVPITLDDTVAQVDAKISPTKAKREMEEAFENFDKERRILEDKRLVSTPEPQKTEAQVKYENKRKTLGNIEGGDVSFDVKSAKERWEMELAFEKFVEEPVPTTTRAVKTPDAKKSTLKDHRRTMGTKFVPETELDLEAAKAERELELDFENFEEEPVPTTTRAVKTPDAMKSTLKDHRRTMGTKFVPETQLDLKVAKAERELELEFEKFEEEPVRSITRAVKTPDAKKSTLKDHRRTMGTKFVPETKLDLEAAKAERELELEFENFEEEPVPSITRAVKTPDAKKSTLKDHRRTMGTKFVPETEFDLEAAKAERELELEFENFEEEPLPTTTRAVKTPDAKKSSLKDHRRTMGTKFVPETELDPEAAKAERELELEFENFEEEPVLSITRAVKTPDAKKSTLKDHRRTMGTKFVPETELDLEAAKAERELELEFENFEEEPVPSITRAVKTPDAKKSTLKDHRRTMGTKFVPETEFDLEAAKAERELELEFENFEEEPLPTTTRAVKTPDAKKSSLKDHRRTMGTKFVPETELDLEAAKAERELELEFENFEEEPVLSITRAVKTPDAKKSTLKDHRRTMGTKFVPETELDLEAAKAERELELEFENFEEEPVPSITRAVKTPDAKKSTLKDHRRTMGTKFVPETELDLEAAKAERELELEFENFEEEPVVTMTRAVKTPDAKKSTLKDHRRTMGTKFVPETELDLEAAKAERELELEFENFEEEPLPTTTRAVKTPDAKKSSLKDHRRTMGTKFVPETKLDLEAAKAERELELEFENFEEEPVVTVTRAVKTPDVKKSTLKDHRRTMGTKFVPETELDLEAAKAELELELEFEKFEEEPVRGITRAVKTPDAKKSTLKDHRRTMGTKFVPETELDLEAAKAERELELEFENFEEEPVAIVNRAVKTPDAKKSSLKDHRRTMGTKFVPDAKLDLEAAKAERELELEFENFEEEPVPSITRAVKTPDAMKSTLKDHRRTMGTKFVPETELDLEAAKAERELELEFEKFEEEPVRGITRAVKTPDAKKSTLKDHRRTMGTKFVPETELDLEAAKAERELELEFENFEEEPVAIVNRAVKTPDAKKSSLKDHRRTMGTKFVPDAKLDLEAAKAERELELEFENFEEEPVPTTTRAVKTPDAKKSTLKDHRRTMGTKFVPETELDLEAAKAERELELEFEKFEEEPVRSITRAVKTPDAMKSTLKDHRRTMGTKFVPETELDLEAAKAERELELEFENFEEEPVVTVTRAVKTPDAKKSTLKDYRRTMGTKFVPETELDLEAAKAERELELEFENFEEEPVSTTTRAVRTPEPKKSSLKDHRRTMGTDFVPEIKLNLAEEKLSYQSKLSADVTSLEAANKDLEVKSNTSVSSHIIQEEGVSDSASDNKRVNDSDTHDTSALHLRAIRRRQNSADDKRALKHSESVHSTKRNKNNETQIESTDVESECTDDEKKHEKSTRKKRGLKVKSGEESQHLEPIIEQIVTEESARKETPAQHTKSSLNLQAEVETTIVEPNKCTRSVDLNVVLPKSSSSEVQNIKIEVKLQDKNACEKDIETPQIKSELEDFKVETTSENDSRRNHKESVDLDEVIPSTPVTKANQRRRPQKKPESPRAIGGIGLRRTRRGSVQQDVEVKIEPVDDVELSHSTPLRSLVNLKAEDMSSTAEKTTPIRSTRRGRKPAEVEDIGEVILSTPLPLKTRGRRAIRKSAGTSSTKLNEDTKASDEGGVHVPSGVRQNAHTEDADEIVPSTPLQEVRRGRKGKSEKKSEAISQSEECSELTKSDTNDVAHEEQTVEKLQSVPVVKQENITEEPKQGGYVESNIKKSDDVNKLVKTEGEDKDHPKEVPLDTTSEHKVELIEVSTETLIAPKTRGRKAVTTLAESKPRRRGAVAKDSAEASDEIQKIDVKDRDGSVKEAVDVKEDLIEPPADEGEGAKNGETTVEKENEKDQIKLLPLAASAAKTRSRRNASKDEPPKAIVVLSVTETESKPKMSARVRSQRAISISDQTDVKSPVGKRGRGRPARGTATVQDDVENIRTEKLKEPSVTDSVVTSTTSEKNTSVSEEASALVPVHKSGQKRSGEQALEIQTEKTIPPGKRFRKVDGNTESKESVVSTAELAETDSKEINAREEEASQVSLGNKKRARVESVKSQMTESKTQSPLRKRGRRQDNTVQEEPTSELLPSDQAKKLESEKIIREKEDKMEVVAVNRGRGRKLVTETKKKTDSEIVKAEADASSEKRPARSRRAAVQEVSSSCPIEEVGDAPQSEKKSNEIVVEVGSHNTESEGTSDKKPTRSRRVAFKEVSSSCPFEEVADELKSEEKSNEKVVDVGSEGTSEKKPTRSRRAVVKEVPLSCPQEVADVLKSEDKSNEIVVDAESENEKSEGTSERKPTRSRRAPVKDNEPSQKVESNVKQETANVDVEKIPTRSRRAPTKTSANVSRSHVNEEISHQDALDLKAEDIDEKTTTRTRKATTKNNTSIEVTSIEEAMPNVDTVKVDQEENLSKKSARLRRLPAKYNTSVEVSTHPTDDEHQKLKSTIGRPRKAASKTASEDANANTSQHNTTTEMPRIEDDAKELEIAPKTTRVRKPALLQDPKPDEKHTPTVRGRRLVAKVDTEDDSVEKPTQKPTRGKREAQIKAETSAANTSKAIAEEKESLAPPKKTTRTRKAATQNEPSESEDEDHQKDSVKKNTRSRKITEPALEDEAKVSKRGNRHLQEVLPDDSGSTPKRTRRKLKT